MSQDTLANDPTAANNLRAQLDRAEADRNRRFKNINRQRQVLESIDRAELETARAIAMNSIAAASRPSEGLRSSRRINEALRPQAPNTAPSVTANDPYRLESGIPVLRLVNSRFEQTSFEPVPFSAIARASASRNHSAASAQIAAQKPPTHQQDTLGERFKAKYLATSPQDLRWAAQIVAIYLATVVALVAIVQYISGN